MSLQKEADVCQEVFVNGKIYILILRQLRVENLLPPTMTNHCTNMNAWDPTRVSCLYKQDLQGKKSLFFNWLEVLISFLVAKKKNGSAYSIDNYDSFTIVLMNTKQELSHKK